MTQPAKSAPARARNPVQPETEVASRILRPAGLQAPLRALLAFSPAIVLPVLYALLVGAFALRYGQRRVSVWDWVGAWLVLSGFGLILALAVRRLRREQRPIRSALEAAPTAVLLQFGAMAVLASFTEYKVIMQQVQPFWADALLSRADWVLHLGHHPWQFLPLEPAATYFLNAVYLSFFLVLFAGLTGWAWFGSVPMRARVFTAHMLCWLLLGTVMATLVSSAGPVYLERLGVSDAYAPLTRYLSGFEIEVLNTQEALWLAYSTGVGPGGISAMPSLHVAMPTLFTLSVWGWRKARTAGIVLTLLTLIATIHLGWHYALDGYLAIAGTLFCWWLAGLLVPGGGQREGRPLR